MYYYGGAVFTSNTDIYASFKKKKIYCVLCICRNKTVILFHTHKNRLDEVFVQTLVTQ